MVKADVINVWPKNCEYPLWRKQMLKYNELFNRIITVFMNPNTGHDYSEFVKKEMQGGYIHFLDNTPYSRGQDWRDACVNYGLLQSDNSEWILFTEQDFFFDERLLMQVSEFQSDADVIGVDVEGRLHPCFLMIKRDKLNQTKRDFSANPDSSYDHFGRLQKDIESLNFNVKILDESLYTHMNGLSHNFRLISEGQMPNYQPQQFAEYIQNTLDCGVNLDNEYVRVCTEFLQKMQK